MRNHKWIYIVQKGIFQTKKEKTKEYVHGVK